MFATLRFIVDFQDNYKHSLPISKAALSKILWDYSKHLNAAQEKGKEVQHSGEAPTDNKQKTDLQDLYRKGTGNRARVYLPQDFGPLYYEEAYVEWLEGKVETAIQKKAKTARKHAKL
jgi:hypothetical protein